MYTKPLGEVMERDGNTTLQDTCAHMLHATHVLLYRFTAPQNLNEEDTGDVFVHSDHASE